MGRRDDRLLLFGSLLLAIGVIGGRWVLLTDTTIPEPRLRSALRISAARIGLETSRLGEGRALG